MNRANIGKYQQTAVEIGRVLVGVVFVFSGFVKAVDPWGTAYKFHDYFAVWNLTFLDVLALPASLGLSAVEFTLGACLLAGVYRKIVSGGVFLFMCFMTILTLYLMIFNPVTDCGCFGDALVITNAQTFWKNVVLLAASGLVFRGHRRMTPLYSGKYRLRAAAWAFVFIMSVSIYAFRYLPPLDFRPYRIGNNIPEQMQIPEGAAADVYETTLIYEKDGIRQKFTIENYPKEGSGWTFVETLSQLVKKGYEPPIHGFSITTAAGDDITDEVLTDSGYTFLLVAHKLENADDSNAGNINAVYDYAVENRYRFLCLTASLPGPIAEWKDNTGAEYPFATMDEIPLKTMIRSNPGLLLIKDGTVINKWPFRRIPGDDDLQVRLEESPLGLASANRDARTVGLLALGFVAPLCILRIRNKKSI